MIDPKDESNVEKDARIARILAGATDRQMDQQSLAAAIRLDMKIEQHQAFIALMQRGELVARRNAEGEDVFYAKEFAPDQATELIRLPRSSNNALLRTRKR